MGWACTHTRVQKSKPINKEKDVVLAVQNKDTSAVHIYMHVYTARQGTIASNDTMSNLIYVPLLSVPVVEVSPYSELTLLPS